MDLVLINSIPSKIKTIFNHVVCIIIGKYIRLNNNNLINKFKFKIIMQDTFIIY